MSDLEFDVEIENGHVIAEVEAHVERGVRNSLDSLTRGMKMTAQKRIRDAGAVWTTDLVSSFEKDTYTKGDWYVAKLRNTSDHARPIEYGAEYGDEGPPVAALIPWVEAKMAWWDPTQMAERYEPVEADYVRRRAKRRAPNERADALAVQADEATIRKAFYLQQHIKETGIDAVRYMKEARDWAEDSGPETVAAKITQDLQFL